MALDVAAVAITVMLEAYTRAGSRNRMLRAAGCALADAANKRTILSAFNQRRMLPPQAKGDIATDGADGKGLRLEIDRNAKNPIIAGA